jgi:dephospho-CoA kinase
MNAKNIFIISGIPGSGKSVLAKKIWNLDPKFSVIISNDEIRKMLTGHDDKSVNQTYNMGLTFLREQIVLCKEILIKTFLKNNNVNNIIVDACHFDRNSILFFESLASKNVKLIYILIEVNPEIALARAQKRERKEDAETISFVSKKLKDLNHSYNFVIKNYKDEGSFLQKFSKTEITINSFFNNTKAVFENCTNPEGQPLYISPKSKSEYYIGCDENGYFVIRRSNHWIKLGTTFESSKVKSCFWEIEIPVGLNIDTNIYEISSEYLTNENSKFDFISGKCYMKDFKKINH